ncbi:MAG: tetratricopeptide repeat protein [Fuerstiella sp.]
MAHSPDLSEAEPRRVLNLKALAILAGAGTLLSICVGQLHGSQVLRTSEFLKRSADEAYAAEDFNRSFDLYEQYLTLNPNDTKVEETISQILEDHGNSAKSLQRAFQINEQLLLSDKSRDDIRLRQIRIAERLGRYSDAAVHLQHMRDQRSDLSDVWYFSGIVAKDTGAFEDAISYFSNAIALKDPVPEAYQFLADLKTSESKAPEEAERLLNQMIAETDSPKTRQIRAQWLLGQNRQAEAIPDLWLAIGIEPNDVKANALLLKSIRQAAANDTAFKSDEQYGRLIKHLNSVLSTDPDHPRLRMYLSSALWATGQHADAIKNLRSVISRDPRQFEMYEVLVDYLVSDRQYAEAQQLFDQIPERAIARGRREFMRGRLLMSQKNWQEAIDAFDLAIGFSNEDTNITSRARVCLALCRRESGDNVAAMEAYRMIIQSNPDYEGGRLGMASAYLRAEQLPLAIAEYRQLLHVDGVPEFLSNLMIKYNLSLPVRQRNWSEVRELLQDENPIVADPVQRSLLQADLLFAEGFPAQAMDHLDRAARRMPDRPEIERARQRLSNVHGDRLQQRVLEVLAEDARNTEGHISMLRLYFARQDMAGMTIWINNLLSGKSYPQLTEQERNRIFAESATIVADAELVTRGQSDQLSVLQGFVATAWRQLSVNGPEYLRKYVRFVGVHQSAKNALTVAEWVKANADIPTQAACWVECLKADAKDTDVQTKVTNELVSLIRQSPSDMSLRLTYAESRILMQQYADAETLLTQIVKFDPENGKAFERMAWLASLVQKNASNALELSELASRFLPGDPQVRSVRGLALAEAGEIDRGLEVLLSIPPHELTVASQLYQARALMLANRTVAAKDLVLELSQEKTVSQLDPAEVRLLTKMQQDLQVQPGNPSKQTQSLL